MTKDEAQNILEVLAGFSDGFNRLMSADALLSDEDERRKLRRSVGDMFSIMYGEIESPIYRQFPELAPDREGRLSSQLPAAQEPDSAIVTAEMVHDLRQIILETCGQHFLKVARVVVDVCTDGRTDVQPDDVHQVIIGLCEDGLLDHEGDVREMRFSEIRLPRTNGSRHNVS